MSDQSWYWTPEWQAGERETAAEIAAGRVHTFASAAELLVWLTEPYDDGEGPIDDPKEAKRRAKAERQKPEHHRPPGHADDLATIDGDLDEPTSQKPPKEGEPE